MRPLGFEPARVFKISAGALGAGLLDRDAVNALAIREPIANAAAVLAVRPVFQARVPIRLNADALIGLAGDIARVHVGLERGDVLSVSGLGFCPLGRGFGRGGHHCICAPNKGPAL